MASMLVDERDIRFVLFEQLGVGDLCASESFGDFSEDLFEMILEEAHKLSENILFPLNLKGDTQGARLENGKVYSTPGTGDAYQTFVQGGWLTGGDAEEVGGQGLPHCVMSAAHEMFFAANFPFMCYVNLTHKSNHPRVTSAKTSMKVLACKKG